MNLRLSGLCLVVLGGLGGLCTPATAQAGTVGYYKNATPCSGVVESDPSAAIIAAGHTPVVVTTLDAASLAHLDGLIWMVSCQSTQLAGNQALTDAVENGMALFFEMHMQSGGPSNTSMLPGVPPVDFVYSCQSGTTTLAPDSPIADGPVGQLTNASLNGVQYCSSSGYITDHFGGVANALPAYSVALLKSDDKISAFAYPWVKGKVAVSLSTFMFDLPGGSIYPHYSGTETYYANVIKWLIDSTEEATTCASEGYKGTQLTWCQNICENGLTGQVLDTWIQRWTRRYRELPYCAVEDGSK